MSVEVQNLVKKYGEQRAVDSISFVAKPGEILGFLGPNGAGKSTTMKILTQYINADEGTANVCGYDLSQPNMDAKKVVGYLPEHNSLYKDMYVKEYLSFVAGIHQLDSIRSRVIEIIEQTGLTLEQHKKIGMLSKGYKQRVGLAQAMIHDPQVLILDEPTSGLDPNQLVEIRKLIKDLGKEKTVIFSSHIMQEVQALCDRVVIIDRGKIVADREIELLDELVVEESCVTMEVSGMSPSTFKNVAGVVRVETNDSGRVKIFASKDVDIREALFDAVVSNGGKILSMHKETSSVEDVFHKLTTS